MKILDRIVTPAFVAFQAHTWFAYAIVFTFGEHMLPWVVGAAAVKEFYIDKHFESAQSFLDNLEDWLGYLAGATLAALALRYL